MKQHKNIVSIICSVLIVSSYFAIAMRLANSAVSTVTAGQDRVKLLVNILSKRKTSTNHTP